MINSGVLSDHQISQMITKNQITAVIPVPTGNIQPASLDLRLGHVAYRMIASVLPGKNTSVKEVIAEFSMHELSLENGMVLEKNCVYIVPLMEALDLPVDVNAIANAKSTTGRLDVFTRLITDNGVEFDRIPSGYSGPLYAEISPRSFSVLVRSSMRLNQIRFRMGKVQLDDIELATLHAQTPLVNTEANIENGLGFSVDLSSALGKVVGYRAKPHTSLIDFDRLAYYQPKDYWDEVYAEKERIILDPGAFYILASREEVRVPSELACEMAPYLALVGEFRVHYAGFFDPGFGMDGDGGSGSRGVLEVRCHESPFVLNHAQCVGRLIYERMSQLPKTNYGAGIGSNYQGQGLKLAKQFKS